MSTLDILYLLVSPLPFPLAMSTMVPVCPRVVLSLGKGEGEGELIMVIRSVLFPLPPSHSPSYLHNRMTRRFHQMIMHPARKLIGPHVI